MTYTQLAIEKSIEGGWKDEGIGTYAGVVLKERNIVFLDPDFWICLGKSLGLDKPITKEDEKNGMTLRRMWIIEWHKFIDHLADKKDPETFFKELLKVAEK